MPVVIDEVVISVEVANDLSGGAATSPSAADQKQAIVEECVECVLEILRHQAER